MSNLLTRLGDRLLARIVPNATAAAHPYCPPDQWYQYECVEHVKYRRIVYRYEDCSLKYGAWTSYSHC